MKQLDGPGSTIAFFAIMIAAICAECIPVMFGFTAVAVLGIAWDMLCNWRKIKQRENYYFYDGVKQGNSQEETISIDKRQKELMQGKTKTT